MRRSGCRRIATAATMVVAMALAAACSSGPPAGGGEQTASAPSGRTTYPITITQPDGSTATIAAAPTRIVTIGNPRIVMDTLLALGVAPIGGLVYDDAHRSATDARGIPEEVADQITTFTQTGSAPIAPDLEATVGLAPDLIVTAVSKLDTLPQLEAIAPVLGIDTTVPPGTTVDSLPWAPGLRELGRVLDRQDEAQQFFDKFEAAAAPVRQAIAGRSVDFAVVINNGASFNLLGAGFSPMGRLLTYLGLKLPTSFPEGATPLPTNPDVATISTERAEVLDADYLLVGFGTPEFMANPVITRLPAVRAGRVVELPRGDYPVGDGYLTAGAIGHLDALAGIEKMFTTTGTPPS